MTKKLRYLLLFLSFTAFAAVSHVVGFENGKIIANNFLYFSGSMLGILPVAFVLIGLFEVWISRETIQQQMGSSSGFKGYLWAIVLAGPTAGGMYVSFPVAYALFKKGADLRVIFFYVGSTALCRIPMTLVEASFLGLKFTFLRLFIALPLVLISSIIVGNFLKKRGYRITSP